MPPFSTKGRLAPPTSVDTITEPFGAGPLNTTAVIASGKPAIGSGLSMASRSSGDVPVVGAGFASGALPRAAT